MQKNRTKAWDTTFIKKSHIFHLPWRMHRGMSVAPTTDDITTTSSTATINYPNGDTYVGECTLPNNAQHGQGRYTWKNGNEYVGQWCNGYMHGKGSLIWCNGNRYDGGWENGRPMGNGSFRWGDGGLYIGIWSRNEDGEEDLKGIYYNSGNADGDRDPRDVLEKELPKLVVFRGDCSGGGGGGGGMRGVVKKQGVTISKGHKNYELMLNLQLGIRHAVGRQAAQSATLDLKSSAFDPKEKVWTKFPPEGSKYTPPHQSCDFRWKDYCPLVFRTLRRLFKVDAADYMLSICGDDALRELSSPGKSGSFFYLTNDDRYMIKTIKKAEVKVLLRMLPAYFKHVRAYENTLVTKFFGLHCVKLTGAAQKKVRFVIMGNLFCSEYTIQRRFDLKGSSHGRITSKPESEIDETTTLKDLDLNYIFRLQSSWFEEFRRQVDRDCELLEQERIMDYSLLVGLHFRDPDDADIDSTRTDARLGIGNEARVEKTVRSNENELIGEPTGEMYDVVLFFGIIDILQDYDISKKLEHAYKSFQYDATSISAVDPKQYSRRFKDFIYKAFVEDS